MRKVNPVHMRWRLVAAIYAVSLLYVLFQGGRTSLMLFMILNLLLFYLLLGRWSGIAGVQGSRSVKSEESAAGERSLFAGHRLHVKLQIKVPGIYPIPYVIVRDRLVRHNGQHLEFDGSFILDWRRTGELAYETPPLPRGEYRFEQTVCSTYDIFGLFKHEGIFESAGNVTILPQVVPLRRWQGIQRGARGPFSHAIAPRSSKETTQINGVREYLYGDRLSRVHWNATAKTGDWKSKEFERESLPRTMIILDRYAGAYPASKPELFELAVSIAASLADSGLKGDTVMGLLSAGDKPVIVQPKPGVDQRSMVMKHLTNVDADASRRLYAALQASESLLDAGTFTVLITADEMKNVLPCMEWLNRQGMSPCLLHIAADGGRLKERSTKK
ncbi:DUF58 domain-containing protein [Paenibacillus protaetiae]|uniref:DUF58 domain-containing protein n=1 Tax=Paenibacillus protaetiae TaxID=2509456 RepID=UPI001FC9195E|nr:DUF58 domain-containing protein [Paenibacillus protaetiae]